MADIRLISLLAPQSVKPTNLSQSTGREGFISDNKFSNGSLISGFIINRDQGGNPILRTEAGDITFSSKFFLKIGAEVTIKIEAGGANGQQARILTVDGKTPEVATQISSFSEDGEVFAKQNYKAPNPLSALNASVSSSSASAPKNEPGVIVYGTLLKANPATATTPQNAAGATVAIKILSVETPKTQNTTTNQSATTSPTATPNTPAAYSAYNAASNTTNLQNTAPITIQTPAPQTTQQTVTVQSSQQPRPTTPNTPTQPATTNTPTTPSTSTPQNITTNAPTSTPALTAQISQTATVTQANQVSVQNVVPAAPTTTQTPQQATQSVNSSINTATVIAKEANGEAILQTSAGLVRVQPETELAVGSKVTYRLVQITPPPLSNNARSVATGALQTQQPAPFTQLGTQWHSLHQLLDAIKELDAKTLQPTPINIPGVITSPNVQSAFTPKDAATGLFLFMTLLKGSNVKEWLGNDKVDKLRNNGYSKLVNTVESELRTIGAQFTESKPGQWQPLFFPMLVDGELEQLRLFVKKDKQDENSNSGQDSEEDTRFIIELDLSKLGEIQMDGFIKKQPENLQFDLMIRSHINLDDVTRQTLRSLFNKNAEISGFNGSLNFQTIKQFHFSPFSEIVASHNTITA